MPLIIGQFEPVEFFRDDQIVIAYTRQDYWQYLFDGWRAGGPAPANPGGQVSFGDLEAYAPLDSPNFTGTPTIDGVPIVAGAGGGSSEPGADGQSAYELAVAGGFVGTQAAWLESLVGDKGDTGLSAYQLAVQNGYQGDIMAWLASLEGQPGEPGEPGEPGLSAYQVAVQNGFVGTEVAWLASLEGQDGQDVDQTALDAKVTGLGGVEAVRYAATLPAWTPADEGTLIFVPSA